MEAYKRVTWLLESHVTWNQVHGLTSVGSQLCRTLLGSESLVLKAWRAFPTQPTKTKDLNTRNKKHSWLDFTRTYNWKAKGKVERWTCKTYLRSWLRWFGGETGEKGEIGQRGKLKVPFFLACEKILVCIKEEGKNLEWVKD